jgi:alpha-N-arabinofuranosidase
MRQKIAFVLCVMSAIVGVSRADQSVYSDQLDNGWQNWSWATVNLANANPVHSSTRSASVSAAGWQAIYLHHDAFDSSGYQSIRFWIHGGSVGGQRMQVQGLLGGTAQAAVAIGPLGPNQWQQVEISLSSLGVANKPNLDGFWIQDTTGMSQPTWFVDDFQLISNPPPPNLTIQINASQLGRIVDSRMFGVNAAVWDSAFGTQATTDLLNAAGNTTLRFPGGSLSDDYHWATNTTGTNTWTWATSFDKFAAVALGNSAQVIVTANYGTGTPTEAADWVRYSNVTKGYGFRYWEIGNENYGSWESDNRSRPHDPSVYASGAQSYIQQMKAADPSIKIGVVLVTGEDSYANYTDLSATNPRTGQVHHGWTPVMLSKLKQLGVTPDYVIYHKYAQAPFAENDEGLLGSASTWQSDVADIRQQLDDYFGAASSNVEIVCTENNSVYTQPGKQSTSLVNGLFLADSTAQAMQTELRGLVWWDMRNGQETGNNNSASLYGWRNYGDYGIVSDSNDRYPTYFVKRLLQFWALGGDVNIAAASNYSALAAYAVKRVDGKVSLLVINKSSGSVMASTISLAGFTPDPNATVYSYGIPQDEAARTGSGSPDVAQSTISNAGASFSYSFGPYSATVISLSPSGTPPPPPPPAAPTSLTAKAISASRIDLAWKDNSSNEAGFKVERSLNNSTWTQIATVSANVVSYSNTGLSRNTLYYYRVRAYNTVGNSGYSNVASARTLKH